MTTLEIAKKQAKNMDLEQLLEEICVGEVDEEHCKINNLSNGLLGWYYVADLDGVNSYFSKPEEAFFYRLIFINRILNS